MKLDSVHKMKVLDIGEPKHKVVKFPQKHKLFIKDQNKTMSNPPAPNATQSAFLGDGSAAASANPRRAKFFGIKHSNGNIL